MRWSVPCWPTVKMYAPSTLLTLRTKSVAHHRATEDPPADYCLSSPRGCPANRMGTDAGPSYPYNRANTSAAAIAAQTVVEQKRISLARPSNGVVDALPDGGDGAALLFVDPLAPSRSTLMLNLRQTSSNSMVKTSLPISWDRSYIGIDAKQEAITIDIPCRIFAFGCRTS